jgi:hypothetical protein
MPEHRNHGPEVYEFIRHFVLENNKMPTLEEIARGVGLAGKSGAHCLRGETGTGKGSTELAKTTSVGEGVGKE